LFALKEAIASAHQEGDSACLQHCLVANRSLFFFAKNNFLLNFSIFLFIFSNLTDLKRAGFTSCSSAAAILNEETI
jgi:hypothetical protein